MILLLCVPAPVIRTSSGFHLDIKFVEGMRAHVDGWSGGIHCVLWEGASSIPFGKEYALDDLGFDITVLKAGSPLPRPAITGASVAMISADIPQFPALCQATISANLPTIVGLEYTFETRLKIAWLNRDVSFLRKLRQTLWLWRHERQLKHSIKFASGVQFNGYPAYDAYSHLVKNPYLYLDNRMSLEMMATPDEMKARTKRLMDGESLRLIHSGRLEPMKGAQDLLPVMRALKEMGVQATLDIYGTGSLENELREGIKGFDGAVRLHGPIDFKTQLVPIKRTQADIFLSCHRQSDPSCTYLEAMGCGLALAGYRNHMWERLSAEANSGLATPHGKVGQLAEAIAEWDKNRKSIVDSSKSGLAFAQSHDFHKEFLGRMNHLRLCAL